MNEREQLLAYIRDNPGEYGYQIAIKHQPLWGMFHTATLLREMVAQGYLRATSGDRDRTRYYVADTIST